MCLSPTIGLTPTLSAISMYIQPQVMSPGNHNYPFYLEQWNLELYGYNIRPVQQWHSYLEGVANPLEGLCIYLKPGFKVILSLDPFYIGANVPGLSPFLFIWACVPLEKRLALAAGQPESNIEKRPLTLLQMLNINQHPLSTLTFICTYVGRLYTSVHSHRSLWPQGLTLPEPSTQLEA